MVLWFTIRSVPCWDLYRICWNLGSRKYECFLHAHTCQFQQIHRNYFGNDIFRRSPFIESNYRLQSIDSRNDMVWICESSSFRIIQYTIVVEFSNVIYVVLFLYYDVNKYSKLGISFTYTIFFLQNT